MSQGENVNDIPSDVSLFNEVDALNFDQSPIPPTAVLQPLDPVGSGSLKDHERRPSTSHTTNMTVASIPQDNEFIKDWKLVFAYTLINGNCTNFVNTDRQLYLRINTELGVVSLVEKNVFGELHIQHKPLIGGSLKISNSWAVGHERVFHVVINVVDIRNVEKDCNLVHVQFASRKDQDGAVAGLKLIKYGSN